MWGERPPTGTLGAVGRDEARAVRSKAILMDVQARAAREISRRQALQLGGLGSVAFALYLIANFYIPSAPAFVATPSSGLITRWPVWSSAWPLLQALPHPPLGIIATLLVIAGGTLTCYTLALRLSRGRRATRSILVVVVGFTILFFLTSVVALPNLTSDIYMYILYPRVFTVYHANPYVTPIASFGGDPLLAYGDPLWAARVTGYGPLWTYLSVIASSLAGNDILANLFTFRGLLFAVNLANAGWIYKIAGRIRPDYQLTALLFYAWNPIVVLKGQSHLDPVMVFCLLAAVCLYTTHRAALGLIPLVLSALTKFITAPLWLISLPFLARRTEARHLGGAVGLAALVALAAWVPIEAGASVLDHIAANAGQARSGGLFPGATVFFSLGLVAIMLWAARLGSRSLSDLLKGWSVVMLWVTLFLTPAQYSWYVITLVSLASLIAASRIAAITLVFCWSAFLLQMLVYAEPYLVISRRISEAVWYGPPLLSALWFGQAHWRSLRRWQPVATGKSSPDARTR
jgi:hypothetical protein